MVQLAKPFGISQPTVSRHLKVLEKAGRIEIGQVAQLRPLRFKPGTLDQIESLMGQFRNLWFDTFDRLESYLEAEKQAG